MQSQHSTSVAHNSDNFNTTTVLSESETANNGSVSKVENNSQLAVELVTKTEGGKAGEGGIDITNAEFIAAVFPILPSSAFAAVCTKPGDPGKGGWVAQRAERVAGELSPFANNYIGCSSFSMSEDGTLKARKANFAACHFLMLDDLGTKVPFERLNGLKLSWLIETSPGNFQGGIILDVPITDGPEASRLHNAIIDAEICDPGSSSPLTRWGRLPVAINGKPNYADSRGAPFKCRLVQWRPELRYSPADIASQLQLVLASVESPKKAGKASTSSTNEDEVLTPRAEENPIVAALKARGLYKTPLGSGRHDVTCPWVDEHTDRVDNGSAYFEPSETYPYGGFCCQHSHRDNYRIKSLLDFLGVPRGVARHRAVIRTVAGDMTRVIDAAERELANGGQHYQAGGLIVSVVTDPTSGDPTIVPTKLPAMTLEMSRLVSWERQDSDGLWNPCDPPVRHMTLLHDAQHFRHLPPLAGLARQPYFREADGELVTQPGYDAVSHRFGVFDPRQFALPAPTEEAARAALLMLEDLLTEFRFVAPTDRAAALAAMFTAVTRPSMAHAPAFHARAPVFGSGKTYLCELIGAFAGPGSNAKVSYPTTSEEATKVILSLLMTGPAVIEFDDMDSDWIPHGTIKRMLTTDSITDRILGQSKTATVSTRTLFLGSGNNVGPVRDLLRRVLTINIDPRCATPATTTYKGLPVDRVRKNRGAYVAAVLTIIEAWRRAGSPRADVTSIATFGGAWSDHCRHPLIWLGHPDPASALLEQIRHDPDADALRGLMVEWKAAFGSTPTTVRKAVEIALDRPELIDAMRECPVEDRGVINRSKLGWFLRKNANRIVDGLEFQKTEASGRTAWRIVAIKAPPSPPSPPLVPGLHAQVLDGLPVGQLEEEPLGF